MGITIISADINRSHPIEIKTRKKCTNYMPLPQLEKSKTKFITLNNRDKIFVTTLNIDKI